MRLYIIRHADPDYPNNTITPAGHLEARALARRLATEDLTHLYSSPLGRALDTVRYTADVLGLPPVVEEWLRELSGWRIDHPPWGALAAWDLPGEVIRAEEPYPTHDTWHSAPALGSGTTTALHEAFATIREQSDAFLRRHGYERVGGRYRLVRPHRERIAVFCHGGLGLTWLAHRLEIPLTLVWSGFWLAPSSVTIVLFDERSAEWAVPRCLALGDTAHLYTAGLPVRPRGIIANFD